MWLALVLMMALPAASAVKTVAEGGLSGIERSRQAIVRTEEEWVALWREHAADQPRPAIDFATRTVIGVFLGTRMTAGYGVTITRAEPQGAELTVWYRETKPGPDQLTAQIITTPFHIVSVPRVDGAIRFVKEADVAR